MCVDWARFRGLSELTFDLEIGLNCKRFQEIRVLGGDTTQARVDHFCKKCYCASLFVIVKDRKNKKTAPTTSNASAMLKFGQTQRSLA